MQTRCTISTDLRRSANLQNNCCNIKFRNTTDSSKGVPNNIIKSKSGQAEFIKSKSNSNPSWIRKSAGFKSKSTSRIKGSVRTSPESSPKLHKRLCGVIAGRALCRLALNQGSQTHGLRAARGPRGSLVRPAMLFGNFQITWTYVAKCFEKRCREIIESKLNDTVAIRKPERASAQSFALWQQATIEFTCHDHSPRTLVITCNCSHVNIGRTSTPRSLYHCLFTPHTYIVVLHAHPVRGESHNQRNANGEVATSIPSAVFVTAVALQTTFHSPETFWEILGVCRRHLYMLCRPRESIQPGSLWKAFGSGACVRCCQPPVMAWPSSHCIPAQKFVSVSGELNHDSSPLVLDSDKGVCCHCSFSLSTSVVLHLFTEGSQIQTYNFIGEPH